jgi:Asp-tRNA(Asn)/Glu-tRNA(Gln) amidotransferase C subunit
MSTPDKDDVSTALGLLLETLGEEKQRLNDEGAKAMKIGDFATATAVIQFAQRLLSFQEEVELLTENWKELEDLRDDQARRSGKLLATASSRSNHQDHPPRGVQASLLPPPKPWPSASTFSKHWSAWADTRKIKTSPHG